MSSLLRTENGLTMDIFVVKCTGRGLVVKRPGVLSKDQMLNLVLGVGVLSLLPNYRTLGLLLAGEKQHEIVKARFCTQSCSKVGQILVSSSPTPHPMRSCRGLPYNSPLATADS